MGHPFKISIARNPSMDTFDLILQVGGFKDAKEAKKFADVVAEFMKERAAGKVWVEKVQ